MDIAAEPNPPIWKKKDQSDYDALQSSPRSTTDAGKILHLSHEERRAMAKVIHDLLKHHGLLSTDTTFNSDVIKASMTDVVAELWNHERLGQRLRWAFDQGEEKNKVMMATKIIVLANFKAWKKVQPQKRGGGQSKEAAQLSPNPFPKHPPPNNSPFKRERSNEDDKEANKQRKRPPLSSERHLYHDLSDGEDDPPFYIKVPGLEDLITIERAPTLSRQPSQALNPKSDPFPMRESKARQERDAKSLISSTSICSEALAKSWSWFGNRLQPS
jgi:hypothetical protein